MDDKTTMGKDNVDGVFYHFFGSSHGGIGPVVQSESAIRFPLGGKSCATSSLPSLPHPKYNAIDLSPYRVYTRVLVSLNSCVRHHLLSCRVVLHKKRHFTQKGF